jgi:hypothetical protein
MKWNKMIVTVAVGSAFVLPVQAMEVTAGGSLEVQTNWTALKSLIDGLNTRLTAMQADVNTMKGNISQIRSDVSVMKGDIATMKGQIGDLYNRSNAQISCANQGKLWNGGGCAAIPTSSHVAETGQFVMNDTHDTSNRAYHINFNKPFAHVPDVTTGFRRVISDNNCIHDLRIMETYAYNVTQSGFDVLMSGMANCAGFTSVVAITWVAVDEQQ